MKRASHIQGFTIFEVMMAILIFTLAVVASVGVTQGAVRATKEAKTISTATWLLGNVMTQLETKVETEGFEKGCEKKREAKFEAPFDRFTWKTTCEKIDFAISQTAARMMDPEKSEEQNNQENLVQKMILNTASEYLSESMREIHAEVHWNEGKQHRKIDLTTQIARYDLPLSLPGAGGGTGQGQGGAPAPTPTKGP